MKVDPRSLASLSAVIDGDLRSMERLQSELVGMRLRLNAAESREYRDLAAAGYVLHNLYSALENSFEQISRTFENHVTDPAAWHKELLNKMFLGIPSLRPAVLPEDLRPVLHDLRGFRHLFRHAYSFELDADRLCRLMADWDAAHPRLVEALSRFRAHLLAGVAAADERPAEGPMTSGTDAVRTGPA